MSSIWSSFSGGHTRWTRDALIGGVSTLVLAGFIFVGLGFSASQGNSDVICFQSYSDANAAQCGGGSWSEWQFVADEGSQVRQQRHYTGTTVGGNGQQMTTHQCHESGGIEHAACQFVEERLVSKSTGTVETVSTGPVTIGEPIVGPGGGGVPAPAAQCAPANFCGSNYDLMTRGSDCRETLAESCSWQCAGGAPYNYCSGNDLYSQDNPCGATHLVESCAMPYSLGCGSGMCLPPPPVGFVPFKIGNLNASGHLQVMPALVREGDTTKVYWKTVNAKNCTVTGSNGDSWNATSGEGLVSGAIEHDTTYKLHCEAYPRAVPPSIDEAAVVKVAPRFCEPHDPGCPQE